MTETPKPYSLGQLRIVRHADARPTANEAYRVEETQAPHKIITPKPVSEKEALNLMWDLGSPYPGPRYPDDPWAWAREQAAKAETNESKA